MNAKIAKTFTIDKKIYKDFDELSAKLAINKSRFVENKIKDFVEENKEKLNNHKKKK